MVHTDEINSCQKVCIITGSNSGIGFESAKYMIQRGYEVILACRSDDRGKAAERKLRECISSARVSYIKLDLSSLKSIHGFVDEFHSTGKPLHVLLNNAGFSAGKLGRLETEDGYEMTFGVNHLGHFLLTNLLLEDLKKTAKECGESRIIMTSSKLHDPSNLGGRKGLPAHLDFDNIMLANEGTFDSVLAYKNSKLANILFTYELARRLEGTGVTSNAFHPGFIASTQLLRHFGWSLKMTMYLLYPIMKWYGAVHPLQHAAEMMAFLATDLTLKGITGKYFENFEEIQSSKESQNQAVASKLWRLSEELVHLTTLEETKYETTT
ncbi:retinol dehydrogenase 11-like [Glandiceps talaboti]